MSEYVTGFERALAGSRVDIAGQSMQKVQRKIHHLSLVITPLHQAHSGLTETELVRMREAKAERRELHHKNHELSRILEAGAPSSELEIATQGIWNWGITQFRDVAQVDG